MPRTKKQQPTRKVPHTEKLVEGEDDVPVSSSSTGPDSIDLYAEFDVPRTATEIEIKKAYRKLCLLYHPDKLSHTLKTDDERASATQKFQTLASHYNVLSNASLRSRYDATGRIPSDDADAFSAFDASGAATWDEFFAHLWNGRVNDDSLAEFAKTYRMSEEEERDVLDAYVRCKGDLLDMIQRVMLSTYDDVERFTVIVQKAIDEGKVKRLGTFPEVDGKRLDKAKRKAERERKEAEKADAQNKKARGSNKKAKKDGDGDVGGLLAMIGARTRNTFENLVENLERNYHEEARAKKKGTKKTKKRNGKRGEEEDEEDQEEGWEDVPKDWQPELDDEEFERIQKEMLARRSGGASSTSKTGEDDDGSQAEEDIDSEEADGTKARRTKRTTKRKAPATRASGSAKKKPRRKP
ncbi:DnaJ sub C member 9 [Thoreauomyces humboldtii]|nr:DnaJ sub C member 9 [Thoreauomyces humboldtii]